jgi:hypothetical protein
MAFVRHFLAAASLTVAISASALGQAAPAQERAASATVTAAATASGVRFTAPAEAVRVQLQVFTEGGQSLYKSAREGNVLDWAVQDATGAPLPDGSYLCVFTAETLSGRHERRTATAAVEGGRVRLSPAERAAARDAEPLAIVAEGETKSLTTLAHDGETGQVTSTKGGLTFRTGDALKGTDKEHMRITPEGRVGVGTENPEATLDVDGDLRVSGAIRLGDGTVINSAADLRAAAGPADKSATAFVSSMSATAGGSVSNISGTGTTGRLAKWLDATGSLGDSIVSESAGKVGIGTATPTQKLEVSGNTRFTAPAGSWTLGTAHHVFISDDGSPVGFQNTAANGGSGAHMYDNSGVVRALFQWHNPSAPNGNSLNFATMQNDPITFATNGFTARMTITGPGNVGIGTATPTHKMEVVGNLKLTGAGNGIVFPDGTKLTTATAGGGTPSGTSLISAINDPGTTGLISDARLAPSVARLNGANAWSGANVFGAGLSANNALVTNVGNPVNAGDAVNKAYADANFVKFAPGVEQLSVGDANGTAPMINLRGGSTCCSGPGGHTPAWFKVFQNGSFVATGNLGIGVSPMQGKGYRTSWDSYKGAFRSGYADNEWDDANVGFFSWAGGSNSTAIGLYALAFGDTNSAESTSSIVFGSGNQVKGAAGFSAGAGNRVCDTYGVAFGNRAQSGGPLINGKCDPDTFNIRGLAAVAIGYNVTADQDHTTAMGKFATNNGFTGTFIWSDGSAQQSADTFRNTANNEFAARATGGFRFRTNLGGTTGCNLPAGSGVFNCTSSRTTKENFFAVKGEDVLSKLRKIEVSTWNYIDEGAQVRHIGPMAEDFHGAFGLGVDNKSIGVQDLAGVSLAAVKALDARTLELQQKTEEVEQLRARVQTLEQRLAAIEQALSEKK